MQPDKKIRNDVPYKRERLVRIIVQFRNGATSAGTGFFIGSQGETLTCFHVISGTELRNLRAMNLKNLGTENIDMKNFLTQSIINIQIELSDGTRKMAELIKFSEALDVAMLKIVKTNPEEKIEMPFFEIDSTYMLEYDESTFFCGFQLTGGYTNPTQYPFSINRAVASAFPEVQVAGERYQHIQLNSINLGGNSGAPLFVEGSNTVIGIINGNMNWGGNNLVVVNNNQNINSNNSVEGAGAPPVPPTLSQGSLIVPLCIAYATPIKLIKEKTELL